MVFNNTAIYNAALAGAIGGSCQRWLTKQFGGDYTDLVADCVIFATAVDTEIAPMDVNQAEADLMAAICQQVVSGRYLRGLTAFGMQNVAKSIKALWTETNGDIDPAPIPGSLAPFPHVWYVNPASLAATPDGSFSAPWLTIQAAVDAAATGDTIYLAPVNYFPAQVNIVGKVLTFIGMGAESNSINNILWSGPDLVISDSLMVWWQVGVISTAMASSADIYLVETCVRAIEMTTPGTNLFAYGSNPQTNEIRQITAPDVQMYATGYSLGGLQITSIGSLNCTNCRMLNGSALGDDITITPNAGHVGTFIGCTFESMLIVGPAASFFRMDEQSYSDANRNVVAYTGVIPKPTSGGKVTKNIVVPAIAVANTLAYLDVDLVGTALEDVVTYDQIVAAPISDLAAAGANGGVYVNCYATAVPGIVRLAFKGILAGGAVDFIFNKVGPSGVPAVTP